MKNSTDISKRHVLFSSRCWAEGLSSKGQKLLEQISYIYIQELPTGECLVHGYRQPIYDPGAIQASLTVGE